MEAQEPWKALEEKHSPGSEEKTIWCCFLRCAGAGAWGEVKEEAWKQSEPFLKNLPQSEKRQFKEPLNLVWWPSHHSQRWTDPGGT